MSQLALGVALKDDAMFSNFYAPRGTSQHIALSSLREKSHQSVFLSGPLGTGLSHLLQAACRQEEDSIYLPLGHVAEASPENLFDKLEMHRLVCLDDLHTVITKNTWQHSVFNLFNRCFDNGTNIIFSARCRVDALGVVLPDLLSRLKSGLVIHFSDYREEDLFGLLKYRAQIRGLPLTDEVAVYMLGRLARSTSSVMRALDRLDQASMLEKKRVTLPFVKRVLDI